MELAQRTSREVALGQVNFAASAVCARLTAPAEAAAVLGERELTQRLAVSGPSLRVQQRALAWRHDAALPLAQAFGVQRVWADEVEEAARDPSNAVNRLRDLPSCACISFFRTAPRVSSRSRCL